MGLGRASKEFSWVSVLDLENCSIHTKLSNSFLVDELGCMFGNAMSFGTILVFK